MIPELTYPHDPEAFETYRATTLGASETYGEAIRRGDREAWRNWWMRKRLALELFRHHASPPDPEENNSCLDVVELLAYRERGA